MIILKRLNEQMRPDSEFGTRYKALVSELATKLGDMDLIGSSLNIRDTLSDCAGGVADNEVGMLDTYAEITEQNGQEITVDFDGEISQISLTDLSMEFLLYLEQEADRNNTPDNGEE